MIYTTLIFAKYWNIATDFWVTVYGTQDVEGINIMLDLAGEGVGWFITNDIKGEGESSFKSREATAKKHEDDETGEDSFE